MLTLVKGVGTALKSMFATTLLLSLLTFVFAILFATLTKFDEGLIRTGVITDTLNFQKVGSSMWILLLHGLFLGNISVFTDVMFQAGVGGFSLLPFFVFVFFGAFTLLNKQIGFQCEITSGVSAQEQESRQIVYLRTHLMHVLKVCYQRDDLTLTKEELDLVMTDPEFHECLLAFGTDLCAQGRAPRRRGEQTCLLPQGLLERSDLLAAHVLNRTVLALPRPVAGLLVLWTSSWQQRTTRTPRRWSSPSCKPSCARRPALEITVRVF